jgi:hypothetical protein
MPSSIRCAMTVLTSAVGRTTSGALVLLLAADPLRIVDVASGQVLESVVAAAATTLLSEVSDPGPHAVGPARHGDRSRDDEVDSETEWSPSRTRRTPAASRPSSASRGCALPLRTRCAGSRGALCPQGSPCHMFGLAALVPGSDRSGQRHGARVVGGDRDVPALGPCVAQALKPGLGCVSLSLSSWNVAPATSSAARCSLAWWPQKNNSAPVGRVART